MELLTKETLILWCHVLEGNVKNAMLLCHHLRTQRMQEYWSVVVSNTDTALQGDDLIPVAHGFFLTSTYQCVDGSQRETRGIVALRIDSHVQVGHLDVLIYFVLTVYVDDLTQDTHRASHILRLFRRSLYSNANDDLGSHLAGDIDRIVVLQTTIYQHFVSNSDR